MKLLLHQGLISAATAKLLKNSQILLLLWFFPSLFSYRFTWLVLECTDQEDWLKMLQKQKERQDRWAKIETWMNRLLWNVKIIKHSNKKLIFFFSPFFTPTLSTIPQSERSTSWTERPPQLNPSKLSTEHPRHISTFPSPDFLDVVSAETPPTVSGIRVSTCGRSTATNSWLAPLEASHPGLPPPSPAGSSHHPPLSPPGLAPPLFSAAGSNAWHTNYITAMQAGLILLLHFFSVPWFSVALAVCAYVCLCMCVRVLLGYATCAQPWCGRLGPETLLVAGESLSCAELWPLTV